MPKEFEERDDDRSYETKMALGGAVLLRKMRREITTV
jgi:hypothetical protein